MTMIEVVRQLQQKGHQVDFYVRKDGGILVKSIDGEKYTTGASGNARARQLAGASISEARIAQLKFATRARKIKKPTLDDEVKKEFLRVKKKWNKVFKAVDGKPHPAGYFGWNRINRSIQVYGKKEALRRIKQAELYASGIAYSKNVEHLADFIQMTADQLKSPALAKLAQDIRENAYSIRDEWINPAYKALYNLNKGVSPEEVANATRRILRLL